MTEAREKRNKQIGDKYVQLRKKGLSEDVAIEEIFNSKENELWCLTRNTLHSIVRDKDYGKTTEQRRALRLQH